MRNKIYSLFRFLFFGLLFILHDFFHITGTNFILLFIFMEIFIIACDILLYKKAKIKLSIVDIGLYAFYNFTALKIIII